MKTLIARGKIGKFDFTNPAHVKKALIVLCAGIVLVAALILHFTGRGNADAPVVIRGDDGSVAELTGETNDPDAASAVIASQEGITPAAIYVDVAGAVNRPMVVEMPAGSRVFEAVEIAGGVTANADMRHINQAAILNDGDRIYIPNANETANEGDIPQSAGFEGAASTNGTAPGAAGQGKININTADSDTLQQLTGVGPATAQKILDYRARNGRFAAIEDLQNVSGIGAKTFEKLRDKLTV